ncbi:MAG: beta-ketoacyl-[acyl-carrier-protein] synthase family protein [Steroidobacteraceae bacterium]|jgi:nodulation protein E
MNRVVVTGIGVVSPIGSTRDKFWSGLVEARSGIGPLAIVPTDRLTTRIAAQVLDFDPLQHFDTKRTGLLDRFSQFAVVAARAAIQDAQLVLTQELALQAATIVGNASGGQTSVDESYYKLYGQNSPRVHPLSIPRLMVNAAVSQVSIDIGIKGPTYTIASACASGTHAIGQAFQLVRTGQTPVALAGGTEACLTIGTIKGWEALRVLSADTCRPFSKTRSGLVLGEGAAMFVLETRQSAVARGAPIYAELLGFGMSADAGDIIAIDPDGAARAMHAALNDAKLNPEDIDYVNAHGTGTAMNDRSETTAIRKAFGASAEHLAVSSSKGVLGHSLGAAGALELAATALALHNQTIPPTANFEEADPDCDLDFVPNTARKASIHNAMSNSFAFGGLNAVLVLGRA